MRVSERDEGELAQKKITFCLGETRRLPRAEKEKPLSGSLRGFLKGSMALTEAETHIF